MSKTDLYSLVFQVSFLGLWSSVWFSSFRLILSKCSVYIWDLCRWIVSYNKFNTIFPRLAHCKLTVLYLYTEQEYWERLLWQIMNNWLTVTLFLHGFCRVPQLHWEVHFLFAVLHGQPTRILPDFVEHVDLQRHDSFSCKRPDMKNQWKEKIVK